MKTNLTLFLKTIAIVLLAQNIVWAQDKNKLSQKNVDNAVVMTWNKNTPEQEMKDDIKALKENNGVTINYSEVKRNEKGEIIAIKVSYIDQEGNTGSQSYNGKNPIDPIKFHKNKNTIGFGESNSMGMAFGNFDWKNFGEQFKAMDMDKLNPDNFNFNFSDNNSDKSSISKSKSKIIIKKDGKAPLIIEDGEIKEGGEGYSKEELEELKKGNSFKFNNGGSMKMDLFSDDFDSNEKNSFDDLKKQMEKMQKQLDQLSPTKDQKEKSDTNKSEDKEQKTSKKAKTVIKTYQI
jgi:hypothetical protein